MTLKDAAGHGPVHPGSVESWLYRQDGMFIGGHSDLLGRVTVRDAQLTSLGAVESTIERRPGILGQEHLPPTLLRLSVGSRRSRTCGPISIGRCIASDAREDMPVTGNKVWLITGAGRRGRGAHLETKANALLTDAHSPRELSIALEHQDG
jgi:hypothetical protein